jgi:hypothetical protein
VAKQQPAKPNQQPGKAGQQQQDADPGLVRSCTAGMHRHSKLTAAAANATAAHSSLVAFACSCIVHVCVLSGKGRRLLC